MLCILGIVYVHAWTGLTGHQLAQTAQTGQSVFRWVLMEAFGRSAVPLLGMVSGWLVAGSTRRKPYGAFVAGKAKTILLPMVLWNALSIVLISGGAWFGLLRAPIPRDLWALVDELFCLATPNDINVQTAFLRDLFLCLAVAPFLTRLSRGWLVALTVAVAIWAISGWNSVIVLRPQIPLFFLFGILVRRAGVAERLGTAPILLAVVPAVVLVAIKTGLSIWGRTYIALHDYQFVSLDIAARLAVSFAMWRLAWGLAASPAVFRRIEPYAFLMFCSHLILIWLASPLLEIFPGPLGSPGYPVLFVLFPILAMGGAILIGRGLLKYAPGAAVILSGGRLKADDVPHPGSLQVRYADR